MASSLSRCLRSLPRRTSRPLSSTLNHLSRASYATSSPFDSGPSPPRLPPTEQAEFERLQRTATTQESLDPAAASTPQAQKAAAGSGGAGEALSVSPDSDSPAAKTLGETTNLPLRKGAPPEFEGEVNPQTGEVGGPKNNPLRWGAGGDWSYNGRVTDF